MGGYDGDVLFENLELIRAVRAHGGNEARAGHVYVRRLPPSAGRFWSQRVRQAYDDLAQPARMAVFLTVLPGLGHALARRRPGRIAVAVAAAEFGRLRAGGARVFPPDAALMAPVSVLEREVCGWIAPARWVSGRGVRYSGRRIMVAVHSERTLARAAPRATVRPRRMG